MIEMVGVAVGRPSKLCVANCSLEVHPGEVHAVVGATGAGKTAILDVLVGRRRAQRGVSQILGLDTFEQATQVRGLVTRVPEAGHFDLGLTLRAQVEWWMRLLHLPVTPATIRRALREAEIPDRYFDQPGSAVPPEYRVLVWVALAHLRRHHILLVDDPVLSASLAATRHLTRLFQDLGHQGWCVLLMTRDTFFAENVAHHVTILENGRTQPPRLATGVRPTTLVLAK